MADRLRAAKQTPHYALSLKQPWATLLVYGRKTIEIRRWPTVRRGAILIHAARIPDPRQAAWTLVPAELREAAQLVGGIIGQAQLTGCVTYRDLGSFVADQKHHLNEPDWFDGRVLYGFTFANPARLPFRPYSGWMRFFPVEEE